MYFKDKPNNASLNYDMTKVSFYNYGSTLAPFCITLDSALYNQNSIMNDMLVSPKFGTYTTGSYNVFDFDIGSALNLSRSAVDDWILNPKYINRQIRVSGSSVSFT